MNGDNHLTYSLSLLIVCFWDAQGWPLITKYKTHFLSIIFCFHCDTLNDLKYLFLSPNSDLEQVLMDWPRTLNLAKVLRHHLSFFSFRFSHWPEKKLLVFLRHCTVISLGCWINGYICSTLCFLIGTLLKPHWAIQLIFCMKYQPWLAHYSQQLICSNKSESVLVEGKKPTRFVIRSGLRAVFNHAVARRAHCPVLSVRISA